MKIKLNELEKKDDAFIVYHAYLHDNIRDYEYDYNACILSKYFIKKEDAEKYVNSINNIIAYEGIIDKIEIRLEDNEGLSTESIILITDIDGVEREDDEYLCYDLEVCEVYNGRQTQQEEILFINNTLIDYNIYVAIHNIIGDDYYNYNYEYVRIVERMEDCIDNYIEGDDYYTKSMGTDVQSLKKLKNICEIINEQFYNDELKNELKLKSEDIEIDNFIEFFNNKLLKYDNVEFIKTMS